MINLGNDFDRAVLEAAGINPDTAQAGTVNIDALPATGNVTIRYTAVSNAPAETVRALAREAADGAPEEGKAG